MSNEKVHLGVYTNHSRKRVILELTNTFGISLSVALELSDINNLIQVLTEFSQDLTVIN